MNKYLFYLGLMVFACDCKTDNEYYPAAVITLKNHYQDEAGNHIIYGVPLETLYYSSGCDIRFNKDSSQATLWFIKQRINTMFSGSLKSEFIRQKDQLNYVIRLPQKVKNVFINGKGGLRLLVDFAR